MHSVKGEASSRGSSSSSDDGHRRGQGGQLPSPYGQGVGNPSLLASALQLRREGGHDAQLERLMFAQNWLPAQMELAEQAHFEESGAWLARPAKLDLRGSKPGKAKEARLEALSDLLSDPAGLPLVITCDRRSLPKVLEAGTRPDAGVRRKERMIAALTAGNRLCCLDFVRPSNLLFSVHVKEEASISVIVSHVRAQSTQNSHMKRQYKFSDFVGKGGCLGGCWGVGFYNSHYRKRGQEAFIA